MSHVRTQIRAALAAALTGLPSGARVFTDRSKPIAASDCPAYVVHVGGEVFETQVGVWPLAVTSEITLLIETRVAGDNLGDQHDQLLVEAYAALYATLTSATLGGLVKSFLRPVSLSAPEVDDTTSPNVSSQTLELVGKYRLRLPDATQTNI